MVEAPQGPQSLSADEKKNYIAQWCRNSVFSRLLLLPPPYALNLDLCNSATVVRAAQPMFLYQIVLGCRIDVVSIPAGDNRDSSDSGVTAGATSSCALISACIAQPAARSGRSRRCCFRLPTSSRCRHSLSIYGPMCAAARDHHLSSWTGAEASLGGGAQGGLLGQCVESRNAAQAAFGQSFAFTLHLAAMFYALILCYQCRDVLTEFAETKWITTAMCPTNLCARCAAAQPLGQN